MLSCVYEQFMISERLREHRHRHLPGSRDGLQSSGQQQYQQHDHDQPYPTARIISPPSAVRPGW